MPKSTAMKDEIAALKKKRDEGKITAFKFRQGLRKIKQKYGEDAPSNIQRILRALLNPAVPKAVAKPKPKPKAKPGMGDRKPKSKDKPKSMTITPTPPPAGRKKKKSVPVPKAPPKGRKTNEKMYTAINVNTGKPDFDAPKVTAAERLRQEDRHKELVKRRKENKVGKIIKKNMSKGGASLKRVPAGNKGLKKLPTPVRNRMGFMRKGGVAKKK